MPASIGVRQATLHEWRPAPPVTLRRPSLEVRIARLAGWTELNSHLLLCCQQRLALGLKRRPLRSIVRVDVRLLARIGVSLACYLLFQ
jgi:hypothetical protein